jgi:hypothetical protein
MIASRLILVASLLGAMLPAGRPCAAAGPIRIHPENPRYFEWEGRALVLVASGEPYGSVINPDFDFRKYLATLQAAGLNHTRLFLGDYVEDPEVFGIESNTLSPAPGKYLAPWERSETPGFARGGNKFDLDRWSPAFFERLHAFFREADARGIVVEGVIFNIGPSWDCAPMNARNNVNDTTPVDARRCRTLDNGNVLARQEAYCRKLVRELNPYDNLIFNLSNEPWYENGEEDSFVTQPPAATKAWIGRVAEWVADEESRLPKTHVLGVDLCNQGTVVRTADLEGAFANVSVLNVHYDANARILSLNPSLPRLLAFNETGFNGTGDGPYRVQGWRFLLSGGGLYGNLDYSFRVGREDGTATPKFAKSPYNYNGGGSPALRAQLAILLRFMNGLPLEKMKPDDSFVVGGADGWSVLAAPGEAYAAWLPGDGPVAPMLALPNGRWRAEWVDILSGEATARDLDVREWGTTLHGERRGGGAALRILRAPSDR